MNDRGMPNISRRNFMAAGAASIGAAGFGLGRVRADTPKRGGRLRMGIAPGYTTNTLDPALLFGTHIINVSFQLRNGLVELAPDGKLVPELAESWEGDKTATTWIFRLRKGVQFHNGKELTAEDVIASISHHRGPDSKSAAKAYVAQIAEMKADNPHTVVVRLAAGNVDFPYVLADYTMQIFPAGTTDFNDGIGTGGYVLSALEPGVRAFAKRNPNYFKSDRAHFDEVETLVMNDDSSRTNGLRAGVIDVMNRVDLKTLNLLSRVPGVKIAEVAGRKHATFPMLTDQAPYTDNDVRLALKYAIDRQQLLDVVLQGHGAIGNDQPIPKSARFFNADLPQRVYDLDKAKFHINKAGAVGTEFVLHTAEAAFPGAVDAAALYKEQAAKAGINIKIVREPNDGYSSNVWRKKSWCMNFWSGRATEDWMFSTAYAENAPWNDTNWRNPRFNTLLNEARVEFDDAKRRQLYGEMQRLVNEEGGALIPLFLNDVMALSDKLRHGQLSPSWEFDGHKAAERWWFET